MAEPAREEESRGEGRAWLAGFVALAAPIALSLRALEEPAARPAVRAALVALGLVWAGGLLLAPRAVGARRAALAAGGAAGLLAGVLCAQLTPTVWPMSDVAWHSAKIALAARGRLLEDPIYRAPTIYPFLFGAVLGLPVALGLSVRAALWLATPLSLAFGLWGFFRLARELAPPPRAAWAALALPVVFYGPHLVYTPYLPSPFNLAQGAVFLGLALLVRGWREDRRRPIALAGLLLGLAGLCWYAHLAWIVPLALLLVAARRRFVAPLALGAALPALALLVHLAAVGFDSLGGSGIAGGFAPPDAGARIGALLRNLCTLSGAEPLSNAPAWIGPLVLATAIAGLARRPRPAPAGAWIVLAALPVLLVVLVWAGLRLTFWEPFSWRYAFLLDGLVLALAAGARPWRVGGFELGALLPAALLALVLAPGRALLLVDGSRRFAHELERGVAPVAELVERETAPDEPVLASTRVWEVVLARTAPRPTLSDSYGGTYKYAPETLAGPRWRLLKQLEAAQDVAPLVERLRGMGFRLAIVDRRERSPGWRAIAEGYAVLLENEEYRVVDLDRPGGEPWR